MALSQHVRYSGLITEFSVPMAIQVGGWGGGGGGGRASCEGSLLGKVCCISYRGPPQKMEKSSSNILEGAA